MISGVKFWIGAALSVLLVALFLATVDLEHMLAAAARANYFYIAPAICVFFAGFWLRAFRWRLLMLHIKVVSTRRLFPVMTVGYMANNLLPMRIGEVVRSYYLGEREGVSKSSALATIFMERALDALTLLMFIAAVSLFVPILTPLADVTANVGAGFGLTLSGAARIAAALSLPLAFIFLFAVFVMFALWPGAVIAAARWLTRPLSMRWARAGERVNHIVEFFVRGMAPMRDPKALALFFLVSVPIWGLEIAVFYIIGYSFGFQDIYASHWHMIAAMALAGAVANIGSSLPSSPGGVGLFELVMRETLILFPLAAIDRAEAAAFAAVSHFALLLPTIILGQIFLLANNASLRRLTRSDAPAPEDL